MLLLHTFLGNKLQRCISLINILTHQPDIDNFDKCFWISESLNFSSKKQITVNEYVATETSGVKSILMEFKSFRSKDKKT